MSEIRVNVLCAVATMACLVPAGSAAAGPAVGQGQVSIRSITAYGDRDYERLRGDCPWGDDALEASVPGHGKAAAVLRFCSSYGVARATVVHDRKARRYLLLEAQSGRGSNVAKRYLTLYRLGAEPVELLRTPLAWPTGPDQRFGYRYAVEPEGAAGLRIRLRGGIERGADAPGPGAAAAERERVIRVECGA